MTARHLLSLYDYEAAAKDSLPQGTFDFIAGGVTDEIGLQRNRSSFDELCLRPRMLTGESSPDLATDVLGTRISAPILVAPMGSQGEAHVDAELAVARACQKAGIGLVLSSGSTYPLEQIASETGAPLWFQQYLFKDPGLTTSFAKRAISSGYRAICITVDSGVASKRERNIRNGYALDFEPVNYAGLGVGHQKWGGEAGTQSGIASFIDRSATWKDLERLCAAVSVPVVVKGIMTAEDAVLATEHGAAGVIVSNHGARQLDTVQAPIEVLGDVAAAVSDRCELYLDSGIRRGTDVLKALALGARAVLVGRPIFWGLAVGGEAGVREVISIVTNELATAMAMCGLGSARSVPRSVVADPLVRR